MTLLRIVIPLHLFCLSMISGQARTAFVPRENRYPLFRIMLRGRFLPQKGSPAKRTGRTLRVAAQYIQKTPKNKGLLSIWLGDFRRVAALNALFGVGVDPPQNLLEMGFDRLIALAGPVSHGIRVADQDRTAPGLQRPFRLEGLNHPAGIGAADPE